MPRSTILEAGTESVAELFGDYLESSPGDDGIALVLSMATASPAVRNCIEKSFAALGYGQEACLYATLTPCDAMGKVLESTNAAAGGLAEEANVAAMLDAQALFLLLEGIDPVFVIATDSTSTRMLGQAYRTTYEADSAIRVFGRSSVAFHNLDALLETDAGKQKAWALFKSIPKRS